MDTPEGRAGFLARLRAQEYPDVLVALAFLRAEMRRCQVIAPPGSEYALYCGVSVDRFTEIIAAANRGRLDNGLLATDEH
jgi:hypothetical protein